MELSKSSGVRREAQVTARLWAIVEATRQWHSFGCSALTPHQLEVIFFAGLAPSANSMNLLRRVINTLPKVSVFFVLVPVNETALCDRQILIGLSRFHDIMYFFLE